MKTLFRHLAASCAAIAVLAATLFGAEAAGTGLIFISNERSNDIYVLDANYELVKRIETSRRPRDMHFSADRTQIYVACGDDDVIDIIDIASLEVVDSIPTGTSPEAFVFSPDQKYIYVSNEEDSTLQVIDIENRVIVEDVPTGAEPEGVIATKDGGTVYVTSEVADMVHVVDAASYAVTENILVGTRPRRFIFTPNEEELWVSAELSSEVYVIDPASNEVTEVMEYVPPGFRPEDVTPVGMAITKDGSKVLVTLGRANHIAIVDTATKQVLDYVLVGRRAWFVALSADDRTAIVVNGLSDDVTIVDVEGAKPVKSVPVGRVPYGVLIDD